jgi:hypothetical protein
LDRSVLKKLFFLLILFCATRGFSAPIELNAQEKRYATLSSAIDSLQVIVFQLKQKIDSLSQLISPLKEKENLGYFEHRKLTGLLKESNSFSIKRENLLKEIQSLEGQKVVVRDKLIALYHTLVDSLLDTSNGKAASPSTKKSLARQLNETRQRLAQLELPGPQLLPPNTTPIPTLDENDTPDEIEAKADYFRDVEDKMRHQAALIADRVKDVMQEITIRKKMAELVNDIRFFDQRDEAIGRSSQTGQPASEALGPATDAVRGNGEKLSDYSSESLVASAQLLQYNFLNLSFYEIDNYLRLLASEKQKLLFTADSLAKAATDLDRQAKKQRQSLESHDE